MAADAFQKFKDAANRSITKISVKTSSSLEKSKIKLHIESLTKEMQKTLMEIGEEAYALWLQGEVTSLVMAEKLDSVHQKKLEIEQLITELNSIDDRDNEILGTRVELEYPPEPVLPEKNCCPSCGSECDPAARFCRKCGYQLK